MTAILLGYEDIERARDFFVTVLGFVEDAEWSRVADDGTLARAHLRFEDTVLLLDSPGAHGLKSPRDVDGVTHLIVMEVPDVDAHFRQAAAADAEILTPPADRPWGRDFELRDPGGYIFSLFSSPKA